MMKKVINYLLSNDLAEIPKRGRRELKSIIIIIMIRHSDTTKTHQYLVS